ncbi:MAG TPA: FAD:protein FMN transferase [Bacteroidales bacterium]|nr:FAD:protein FMN transferase [Bacteroidales bacterium]
MRVYFNLILFSCILFISCKEKAPVIEGFNGFIQGTTYSILYDDNKNTDPEDLKMKVEKILKDFDLSLSLYVDSSILSRINKNEEVVPDEYFMQVYKKSVDLSQMTDGAFDITVGPLVSAWGFGPDEHKNFDQSKLDSLLRLTGMDKVRIENDRVVKSNSGVKLDFNAIAQGYSVDVVYDYLKSSGYKNYLIEIGGEVRVKGKKAGEYWRIGIDRPVDNNLVPGNDLKAIIRISDEALATSGNYRKFYVEDGIKYSHTINPKTGYPAKNSLLSATILASDCATADGIATACMVMGVDEAIKFIEARPQFLAYFIFSDKEGNYKTWTSEGLKERLTDLENNQ